MGKKKLSINRKNKQITGIVIEQKGSGYFAGEPMDLSSKGSLKSSCQKADEIYINEDFSSAIYVWKTFPMVAPKHLPALLGQDASDQMPSAGGVNVAFKAIEEVVFDGERQRRMAYTAVEEDDLDEVWALFKGFESKIKGVVSLPVSLAAAVARSQTRESASDFVLVLILEADAVLVIASSQGDVKVARNLRLETSAFDLTSEDDIQAFSQRIDKELGRTINYFKQGFREPEPERIYILGDRDFESVFQVFPLSVSGAIVEFGIASSLVPNYDQAVFSERIHIISSIFPSPDFNFIPSRVKAVQKEKKMLRPVYALFAAGIAGLALWGGALDLQLRDAAAVLNQKSAETRQLIQEVSVIEKDLNVLRPVKGWKTFYDQTLGNQPDWDGFLSDLGKVTPVNIALESMAMAPNAQKKWIAEVSGQIRSENWEKGLAELRDYGAKIDASPFYLVKAINYAPKSLEGQKKQFDFQLQLELQQKVEL